MQDIFIVSVGMTPFKRVLDVDLKTMTRQATDAALGDAGIEKPIPNQPLETRRD